MSVDLEPELSDSLDLSTLRMDPSLEDEEESTHLSSMNQPLSGRALRALKRRPKEYLAYLAEQNRLKAARLAQRQQEEQRQLLAEDPVELWRKEREGAWDGSGRSAMIPPPIQPIPNVPSVSPTHSPRARGRGRGEALQKERTGMAMKESLFPEHPDFQSQQEDIVYTDATDESFHEPASNPPSGGHLKIHHHRERPIPSTAAESQLDHSIEDQQQQHDGEGQTYSFDFADDDDEGDDEKLAGSEAPSNSVFSPHISTVDPSISSSSSSSSSSSVRKSWAQPTSSELDEMRALMEEQHRLHELEESLNSARALRVHTQPQAQSQTRSQSPPPAQLQSPSQFPPLSSPLRPSPSTVSKWRHRTSPEESKENPRSHPDVEESESPQPHTRLFSGVSTIMNQTYRASPSSNGNGADDTHDDADDGDNSDCDHDVADRSTSVPLRQHRRRKTWLKGEVAIRSEDGGAHVIAPSLVPSPSTVTGATSRIIDLATSELSPVTSPDATPPASSRIMPALPPPPSPSQPPAPSPSPPTHRPPPPPSRPPPSTPRVSVGNGHESSPSPMAETPRTASAPPSRAPPSRPPPTPPTALHASPSPVPPVRPPPARPPPSRPPPAQPVASTFTPSGAMTSRVHYDGPSPTFVSSSSNSSSSSSSYFDDDWSDPLAGGERKRDIGDDVTDKRYKLIFVDSDFGRYSSFYSTRHELGAAQEAMRRDFEVAKLAQRRSDAQARPLIAPHTSRAHNEKASWHRPVWAKGLPMRDSSGGSSESSAVSPPLPPDVPPSPRSDETEPELPPTPRDGFETPRTHRREETTYTHAQVNPRPIPTPATAATQAQPHRPAASTSSSTSKPADEPADCVIS